MQFNNEKHFKRLFKVDPWLLVQNKLHEGQNEFRIAESLTSLGNEFMGGRGNFEESYSGDSHQGHYVGGVWFPDRTRVGWWKNGYPKYFGKQINSTNIIPIRISVNKTEIDLNKIKPLKFKRTLNMKEGVLYREFVIAINSVTVTVKFERFYSIFLKNLFCSKVSISSDKDCDIKISSLVDGNVVNIDSNHQEKFWIPIKSEKVSPCSALLHIKTKPNAFDIKQFDVIASQNFISNSKLKAKVIATEFTSEITYNFKSEKDVTNEFEKIVIVTNNRHQETESALSENRKLLDSVKNDSYKSHKERSVNKWSERWITSDVIIEGDVESQQGIRFNLFQLFCTFYGEDSSLNIGPKGFTGEKYGGATYWDTEAYCLSLYLAVAKPEVAKSLLLYRHKQLPNAFINAQNQGLKGALYPMVTFNGLECHNEWEITFEEIHRNGAMVYAIYNYVQYTGDEEYLFNEGADVIIEVARFWADRVHWSARNHNYQIHGVTGPNEFENNVNNNYYTNFLAKWCLEYAVKILKLLNDNKHKSKLLKLGSNRSEIQKWTEIAKKMYLPADEKLGILVQNDGFLNKDIYPVSKLLDSERPIVHHWSWDKILRSCFIKQADTLQTFYMFPQLFDIEVKKNNFAFYEPLTVHESSLSPAVHSIIASEIKETDKALEMYLRSSRLDLDNVNDDTKDGLHITAMAGSWLAIVQGFSQMRFFEQKELSFKPRLPKKWLSYQFNVLHKNNLIKVKVNKSGTKITKTEI